MAGFEPILYGRFWVITEDWILAHAVACDLGEPVESEPHVHRLDAQENPNTRRDHAASSAAMSARSASASKPTPTRTRRPLPSSTSKR
jgi:hypothetical protein